MTEIINPHIEKVDDALNGDLGRRANMFRVDRDIEANRESNLAIAWELGEIRKTFGEISKTLDKLSNTLKDATYGF